MRRPSDATSSSGLLGGDRAVVEHREVDVELRIRADAGDFRGGDAAREHQRAAGGPLRSLRNTVCAAITCGTPLICTSRSVPSWSSTVRTMGVRRLISAITESLAGWR